jgi:hypothetical protein
MAVLFTRGVIFVYCCPVSIHSAVKKNITYYRLVDLMKMCDGKTSFLPIIVERELQVIPYLHLIKNQ